MNGRRLVPLLRAAGRAFVIMRGGRLRSSGNRGCNSTLTSATLTSATLTRATLTTATPTSATPTGK